MMMVLFACQLLFWCIQCCCCCIPLFMTPVKDKEYEKEKKHEKEMKKQMEQQNQNPQQISIQMPMHQQ